MIEGVRTIGGGVRTIIAYEGQKPDTYTLISRSILAGCDNFDKAHLDYSRDTVLGRRAESVYIGRCLQEAQKRLSSEEPLKIASSFMPQQRLDSLIQADLHSHRSVLLASVLEPMRGKKADYCFERLLRFGEQAASRFAAMPTYFLVDGPFPVDVHKLESSKVLPALKRMFRELKVLEEIAYEL